MVYVLPVGPSRDRFRTQRPAVVIGVLDRAVDAIGAVFRKC